MAIVDYLIFAGYMICVLAIGVYHFVRNKNTEDYYVANRSIKAHHVGLSIVATDVGGGFSIGLGGVGFLMGLSGSWLLFTGLVGAWLSAVLIIPKIKKIDADKGFMTYPDFLRERYNSKVALTAALISGIGYLGFTGAQMLAGAKLASATILQNNPFGINPVTFALLVIAVITILYTVIGGLKAVIYTDTIQWIILLFGLIFITAPVTLYKIGGFGALREKLPTSFFTLSNITMMQFFNWMITIIPIWLVGMTLYQRMYACKNVREAKKAWYIAGIFEYPIMAFTGVFLGMCARVVLPQAESEMAMPMLIRDVLPAGVTGIVIASYFSAIMSTADSCLMASSGNFVNDIIERYIVKNLKAKTSIRLSMAATLVIGTISVILAAQFATVLNAILYAYAFMVSGLFVPTLGAYFWKKSSSTGALSAMITGGTTTLCLMVLAGERNAQTQLDFSAYGIGVSAIVFVIFSFLFPDKESIMQKEQSEFDKIKKVGDAIIQHGQFNNRIYLMKLGTAEPEVLLPELDKLAEQERYTKIFAKVPASEAAIFEKNNYRKEGFVPQFYNGTEDAVFLGKYFDDGRTHANNEAQLEEILSLAKSRNNIEIKIKNKIQKCEPDDIYEMAEVYKKVFASYPFPIFNPDYLLKTMQENIKYYCIKNEGKIAAISSAEMDIKGQNVEMTDFATLPSARGNGYAVELLHHMEGKMRAENIKTSYTIARAISAGMNITFSKAGYKFGGRLTKNTNISGSIESMNIWYKSLN